MIFKVFNLPDSGVFFLPMKVCCCVLLIAALPLSVSAISETQDWRHIVIKEVVFGEATFSQVCEFISNQVTAVRPGFQLSFKLDHSTPDRRLPVRPVAESRLITLRLRNVPCVELLRYASSLADMPPTRIETNTVIIGESLQAWLCVPTRSIPNESTTWGVYGNFHLRPAIQEKRLSVAGLIAWVSSAAKTEIVLDEELVHIARQTSVALPDESLTAFELLKIGVEVLSRRTQKTVSLYRPTTIWTLYVYSEDVDRTLGIGIKDSKWRDVRSVFPLYRSVGFGGELTHQRWRSWDSAKAFQEMVENAKQLLSVEEIFFENQLNAFWVITNGDAWLRALQPDLYYFSPRKPDPRKSLKIRLDGEGDVHIQRPLPNR